MEKDVILAKDWWSPTADTLRKLGSVNPGHPQQDRYMVRVRGYQLQAQLRLLTWQELVPALPSKLAAFLEQKYGIVAS